MATEGKLDKAFQQFSADGQFNGVVTVQSTSKFKVRATVLISGNDLPTLSLEIKSVLDETKLIVGKPDTIRSTEDLSQYTVALNSTIEQPEQARPPVSSDVYNRSVFEEEPTVANRTVLVDYLGRIYNQDNPIPIGSSAAGLVPAKYDEINITMKNDEGNPLQVEYKLNSILLRTLVITYDEEGDLLGCKAI